jgi:phage terminase small subunit
VLIANLYFEIHANGAFDSKRQPRFVLDTYRRMVLAQAAVARELGLSPLARKQLALAAQTDDLAAAMARRVGTSEEAEGR